MINEQTPPLGERKETKEMSSMEAELNRLKRNEEKLKVMNSIELLNKQISSEKKKLIKLKVGKFVAIIGGYVTAIGGSSLLMNEINKIEGALSDLDNLGHIGSSAVIILAIGKIIQFAEMFKEAQHYMREVSEEKIFESEQALYKEKDEIKNFDKEESSE